MTTSPNPAPKAAASVPWHIVALAALPGLVVALATGDSAFAFVLMLATLIAPAVFGLVIAVARRSPAAFPVWGLISAGYLAFFPLYLTDYLFNGREEIALIGALLLPAITLPFVIRRQRPGRPPAMSLWLVGIAAAAHLLQLALLGGYPYYGSASAWFMLAPPFAVGLLLAPKHGLRAALLLLPIGSFMMSFDIEHEIYFWQAPGWSRALSVAMPLLFLVISPIWLLRARSLRMQAVGLLLPLVLYYVLLVVALASNSFLSERLFGVDWNQIFTVARPVVAFFSILAVCGAVFVWLWRGDVREETADVDPAFLSSAVVDQVS